MKTKTIIPILLLILSSSCSLKLNKTSMKEYFSHIHKSGKYEVGEKIGNRAILRHYKDTITITGIDTIKAGDWINITVLK